MADFYDDRAEEHIKIGINMRHYSLFKRMVNAGLKPHHDVLEVGCGIGRLTKLISRYLKDGIITGVDISPRSIEYAREILPDSTALFCVDIQDFTSEKGYDFVVLADVLEHLPEESLSNVLQKLTGLLKMGGKLMVHIPTVEHIQLLKNKFPDKLQIIENEICPSQLINMVAGFELEVVSLEKYGLYTSGRDAVWIVFQKKGALYQHVPLNGWQIRMNKFVNRIFFLTKLMMRR